MKATARPPAWPRAVLRVGTSVAILFLLFLFLPVQELWSTMQRVPGTFWLLTLAGFLATHCIGIIKWRLVLSAVGIPFGSSEAAHCYFAGLFGAIFLPSVVGGDAVRVGLALRLTHNRVNLLVGSFLDRVLDFVALLALVGVGSLMLPSILEPQLPMYWEFLKSPLALGVVGLLALGAFFGGRWLFRRMDQPLTRLRNGLAQLSRQRPKVALAFALSLVTQMGLIVLTALIATKCGLHLAFVVWLFAFPLAKLSALLPVTQAGIGIREVTLSALLIPFGVPATLAVAVGLVWETILIGGGLVGGLVSLVLSRQAAGVPSVLGEWHQRATREPTRQK